MSREKSRIDLGWVICEGERQHDGRVRELVERVSVTFREEMNRVFPDYDWRGEVTRRRTPGRGAQVDPLELLEIGVREKVRNGWDIAMVGTGAELLGRRVVELEAAPSSALECGVFSVWKPDDGEMGGDRLTGILRYLLGSMLGLDRDLDDGQFTEAECEQVRRRLEDIGDARLEERRSNWNRVHFYFGTLTADARGMVHDVLGYRPWWQPFRFGRLTAAAFVTSLLSFLGAEVWELGVGAGSGLLVAGAFFSILGSMWYLYRGQNLGELTGGLGVNEQVARSKLVMVFCLWIGMVSLWILLFASCWCLSSILPREVVEGWSGETLDVWARARFAAFVSTLGTLAGALGGNLEDEDNFKANIFFDDEV